MAQTAKGRKGKLGKKKAWIATYYKNGQVWFNQARRLVKHLRRFPADHVALKALNVAKAGMPGGTLRRWNEIYS